MKLLPRDLQKILRGFAVSQIALVQEYEKNSQLETAYLAKWAIAEKFVKLITTEYRRDRLRLALRECVIITMWKT